MGSFEEQKTWADGHIDQINDVVRKLVGKIIDIVPTSPERDRTEAIDYEIKVPTGDIACRIRRAEHCYSRDLTVTTLRPSGAIPEVQKILQGCARWYLYAWAHQGCFLDWMFVDLDVVRREELLEGAIRMKRQRTLDDGSRFLFISFEELHKRGAIVDSTLLGRERASRVS